jgi:hypothetical protein
MSVPYRLFVSKLMPTDGWEHSEQPVTDSPLPDILQVLHRMSSANPYVMERSILSDPAHSASIAMKKMQDIPEIRIIEGLDK